MCGDIGSEGLSHLSGLPSWGFHLDLPGIITTTIAIWWVSLGDVVYTAASV